MIIEATTRITAYIEKNSDIKDNDKLEQINYALQAIFNETFKIVILVLFFLMIGKLNYLLFSMAIMFSTRIFIGGYHCSTTLRCLLFSSFLFFITALLGPILPEFNNYIYYVVAIVSVFVILFYAPFPNKKRPIKRKKRRLSLKTISTFLIILWTSILLLYIKDPRYLNCGFLTILLEAIQIIPLKKEV